MIATIRLQAVSDSRQVPKPQSLSTGMKIENLPPDRRPNCAWNAPHGKFATN
jgi:hypothetical protein